MEKDFGLRIVRGRRLIDAVVANEYQANLLEIEMGAPLIRVESISYLEDNRPIEHFMTFFRADRSRFEVEITRFPGISNEGQKVGFSFSELFLE